MESHSGCSKSLNCQEDGKIAAGQQFSPFSQYRILFVNMKSYVILSTFNKFKHFVIHWPPVILATKHAHYFVKRSKESRATLDCLYISTPGRVFMLQLRPQLIDSMVLNPVSSQF